MSRRRYVAAPGHRRLWTLAVQGRSITSRHATENFPGLASNTGNQGQRSSAAYITIAISPNDAEIAVSANRRQLRMPAW